MKKHYLITLAAGSLALLGTASAANLAMNGDFESGDTSGWTSFPSGSSTFVITGDSHAGSSAGQVTNLAMGSAAIIKQANVGIGLVGPGDQIEISFFAKGSGVAGGVQFAELFSEISGGGVSSSVILGGAPLFLTSTYTQYTFTTTAGPDVSAGVTLQFNAATGATVGSTSEMFIDNVQITNLSAVPEPSSSVLAGLCGVLMLARRRR